MSVFLCILDGWGHTVENNKYNAIYQAHTPYWDYLIRSYPNSTIATSGASVGLPNGQMGNSEVGHMTIGSGRIIDHSLVRINREILNIQDNENFMKFVSKLKSENGRCHVLGLLSPGGVHSHMGHIKSLINALEENGIEVMLHAFLDGRDAAPKSAIEYVKDFDPITICGRYYVMDRDKNLDRTKKAYDLIRSGSSEGKFSSAERAIKYYYQQEVTDEFIPPTIIGDYSGIKAGDGIFMCNFRPDRVIQILSILVEVNDILPNLSFLGMVEYSKDLGIQSILPNINIVNTLGEVVSKNKMTQLRIAETEKYAHVTSFFNGGVGDKYHGEKRILISSPKVATYDLQPEMSAFEITDSVEPILKKNKFDLIVLNYANGDMVGHSGNMDATIKAIETIDKCLSRIIPIAIKNKIHTIITADHGNAEFMYDESSKSAHTAHTTNLVPIVLISDENFKLKDDGTLSDIAPTILHLLKLKKPKEMSGFGMII